MKEYIIIGAGISGLYAGYRLQKKDILIIDKNDYLGGRALQKTFHKTEVQLGAGIITYHNNNLLNLLQELKLETGSFESEYKIIIDGTTPEEAKTWYNAQITKIKELVDQTQEDMSCKEFILKHLGKEALTKMIKYAEYIDYMDASVHEVFTHYPLEDLYHGKSKLLYVKGGWNKLIDTLAYPIKNNIKLNQEVIKIIYHNDSYTVKTTSEEYQSKKIIFAADITMKNIKTINWTLPPLLTKIGSVPFCRLYTHHEKHNIDTNLLNFKYNRKIIPMGKNILMSAYADSYYAIGFDKYIKNGDPVEKINHMIHKFVGEKYQVSEIKSPEDYLYHYWEHGVHYLKPNPGFTGTYYYDHKLGLIICGEMVSKPMGNVEACIRSINDLCRDVEL